MRDLLPIKHSILWRGNAISTVKGFGSPKCSLCAHERTEIVKMSYLQPECLINSCDEFYGACRHRAHFHRFKKQNLPATSTDDCVKHEKSCSSQPQASQPYQDLSVALATDEKVPSINIATAKARKKKRTRYRERAGMGKHKNERKPLLAKKTVGSHCRQLVRFRLTK